MSLKKSTDSCHCIHADLGTEELDCPITGKEIVDAIKLTFKKRKVALY